MISVNSSVDTSYRNEHKLLGQPYKNKQNWTLKMSCSVLQLAKQLDTVRVIVMEVVGSASGFLS